MTTETIDKIPEIAGYKYIGKGFNIAPLGKREGIAMNVTEPNTMIKLMTNPQKVKETIVVTPGGTTTFVAPLLYKHPAGVITYAGAPESHLGIVGRNFHVPIIMTLVLDGVDSIPDGTHLLMNCEGKIGYVYARTDARGAKPEHPSVSPLA